MQATVIGLRHAPADNPANVVYAKLPGFHLSTAGRAQATRIAERLADAPVVAVHASPLERAVETAEIIAERHGLPVVTEPRLTEWEFWSAFAGREWLRLRDEEPDLFRVYAEAPHTLCPEEPLAAVGRRTVAWASEAASGHTDGIVIGVSHDATLAAGYLAAAGRPMREFPSVAVPHLTGVRLRPVPPAIAPPEHLAAN